MKTVKNQRDSIDRQLTVLYCTVPMTIRSGIEGTASGFLVESSGVVDQRWKSFNKSPLNKLRQ